jgi:DNA-binding FadR family transcriptional regulator
VRIRPRVGARVLDPSPHALDHARLFSIADPDDEIGVLLELRHLVEAGIAFVAAQKSDAADVARMLAGARPVRARTAG